VDFLANVQTAYKGQVPAPGHPDTNNMGPNATLLVNGCSVGQDVDDYYAQYKVSIARLIFNQIQRGVYAYKVGVYFSQSTPDKDRHFNGLDIIKGKRVSRKLPNSLPMYAVPQGLPGQKPTPALFDRTHWPENAQQ